MKILFLGDIVGDSGCEAVKKFLPIKIEENKIDFVIANGENAAKEGVGITEETIPKLPTGLVQLHMDNTTIFYKIHKFYYIAIRHLIIPFSRLV